MAVFACRQTPSPLSFVEGARKLEGLEATIWIGFHKQRPELFSSRARFLLAPRACRHSARKRQPALLRRLGKACARRVQGVCKACAASRRRRPFGAASCVLSFACPRPAGEPLLAKGLPDCSDCTPTWGSAQRPSSAGACGARPLALWHSGYPRGPCAAQAVTAFCADSASAPRQASSSCACCWHTGQRGLAHARPSFRGRFSGYAMARRQAGRNGQMQGPCVRSASPPVRSALTGRRGILTIRDVLRAGCKSPPAVLS